MASLTPYKNCGEESTLKRPLCPLISYQKEHAYGEHCMGENCVLCLGGECLYAKQMHLNIQKMTDERYDKLAAQEAGDYICFGF